MLLPKTLGAFLWHFIQKQKISFGLIIGCTFFWAINESLFPYFIKVLVDKVEILDRTDPQLWQKLGGSLVVIALSWITMDIAMRVQGYITYKTLPRFRADMRYEVFEYTRQHDHTFFANNFAGAIANKISDLPRASEDIIMTFVHNLFNTTLAFLISLFVLCQVSWYFAALLGGYYCLIVIVTFLFQPLIDKTSQAHAESVVRLNGQIVDILSNIISVRLFARGRYEKKYLKQFQNEEVLKSEQASFAVELLSVFRGVLSLLFMSGMIWGLIYGWRKGLVTLGDFSLITITSFNLLGMIWHMSYNMNYLFKEMGTMRAALSLVTQEPAIIDSLRAKSLQVMRGEICFVNVTFNYQRNANLFRNQNLLIAAGQKVGLVGFSGSGKTTFANLILRFFKLNEGKILIDGQDIATVTQDSLRAHIAMIPQEPTLFHRTLLENIRYGRLEASDEEVINAAKIAHCHEFIMKLEHGYQTMVGERGIKLSGGQRQRIAIARAILKNAPILILDEATSALDSVTEKLIQVSLKELMKGRTTIIIAHRLSTLADMDRILVFNQGQIVEDGTQEELLKKDGHFAKLYALQRGGLLPEEASLLKD
jgi:ATP-binding cassette subfamily B protein